MSTAMPPVPNVTETQILQFLAAARETIAAVPVCWLATRSLEGGTNARAVNSSAGPPGSDEWTRRFLVRRSSRKVVEMRVAPLVTLAFQHPSGDRYIALGGRATITEDNDLVERPGCAFSAWLRGRQYDRHPSRCRSNRSPCPWPDAGTIRCRTNATGASTCRVMAFRPGLVASRLCGTRAGFS
jgi:Pyridoxamine 5'-phosphate oxidase